MNTDATCRKGLAGLAYDSWTLGQRVEVVTCRDIVKAEHLALLMAMEDADRALEGPIAFRVDSTAVANMVVGNKPRLDEVRTRIKVLLKRHPEWSLVLIERRRNRVANNLACRPFLEDTARQPGGFERRGRHMVVLSAELVDELRPYVYTAVGVAASDVAQVTASYTCRKQSDLLTDPQKRYKAACALLDVFGWRDSAMPDGLMIDLRKHGWALNATVEIALEVADDLLIDAELMANPEQDSGSPAFETVKQRAIILKKLSLAVGSHRLRSPRLPA